MSKPYPKAALSVYRELLRIHRQHLPPPMRALGDNYLRDEMRRHKDAQTTNKQWQTFITEWQQYKDMLTGKGDLKNKGGDIHPDVLEAMTNEQKQQFLDLRMETQKLAAALGVPKSNEP
ncbi:acetate non-utilizing protein 9 [Trebouxia sp. C0009 RCD-2024]